MKLVDSIHHLKNEKEKGIMFFLTDGSEVFYSYGQLYEMAQKKLTYLRMNNVTSKNELVILFDAHLDNILTAWACLLGGIICIPCAPNEKRIKALKNYLKFCKAPICITDNSFFETIQGVVSDMDCTVIKSPELQTLNEIEAAEDFVETADDDVIFVLFSSGSTSAPKGAAMTNRNLVSFLSSYSKIYDNSDSFINWLPIEHNSGLVISHLTQIYLGATQYLVQPGMMLKNTGKMMEIVTKYKATRTGTIRPHILQMIELVKKNPNLNWDLNSLKSVHVGGEPLAYAEMQEFVRVMKQFGLRENIVGCMYGLSESTSGVIKTTLREECVSHIWVDRRTMQVYDSLDGLDQNDLKRYNSVISVGKPQEGVELSVRTDDGNEAAEDQMGVIFLKGDPIINTYYGLEGVLLKDDQGWLNTEDIGLIHKGELYIMGRRKNMIFVNSKNVFCEDIALFVADVMRIDINRLAFVGIPSDDNTNNSKVVCFIISDAVDETFVECCKNIRKLCMENFSIKIDEYFAIQNMPRTGIGKVQSSVLLKGYVNNEYSEDKIYRYSEKYEGDSTESLEFIQDKLLSIFKKYCELDKTSNFFDCLHDSMEIAKIHAEIDELYPEVLEVADLFQYFSIESLSAYLLEQMKTKSNSLEG